MTNAVCRRRLCLMILPAIAALFAVAASPAQGAIVPNRFDGVLKPGESATVTKTVDVPVVPKAIDMMLVVDLTGSYSNDLPRIKALAPGIFDAVRVRAPDARFGLATFVDFPFSPWGINGEYAYRLEQQPTADKATWVAAVNNMTSMNGNDTPESQYEALFQAATGAGREMPNTTDGDYVDRGEIAPGQRAELRNFVTRVFAITTDSEFHRTGDGGPFPYPGAGRDVTVEALTSRRIKVVAIKAPGATPQMDDIAGATEGAVTFTNNTSDQIGEAITAGIEDLRFTVRGIPESCEPLEITFDPPARTDVPSGSTVTFTETIRLPADVPASALPADGVVECIVGFQASRDRFGVQVVRVVVNRPPDCSAVTADPSSLWPANHSLRQVELKGATDPDDDAVTLTVKRVTQDEPLEGLGDGDAQPDARAGPASNAILLRAERSGRGDGRVYVIEYEASDGRGASCSGSARVSVPKNQGAGSSAVDSGQTYVAFGS